MSVVELGRETPPQVAYAIARGVGNAPTRNRVRRRLRHVVRSREPQLRQGHAYLVSAGPSASGRSFAEVDAAVTALLAEVHAEGR